MEDEILERVVHRAARDAGVESDGDADKRYAPELSEAMRLTGGYLEWLRANASELITAIDFPPQAKRKVTRLGKFVAHMRARPSVKQGEVAEREFATRLVSQLARLASCLTLTLNKKSVDADVMGRVRQVAMDTGRGLTLNIAVYLHAEGAKESKTIAMETGQTEPTTRELLRFLKAIEVVEPFYPVNEKGVKLRMHWRLTQRMTRLYKEVMEPIGDGQDFS
jgi:hypothetical protein